MVTKDQRRASAPLSLPSSPRRRSSVRAPSARRSSTSGSLARRSSTFNVEEEEEEVPTLTSEAIVKSIAHRVETRRAIFSKMRHMLQKEELAQQTSGFGRFRMVALACLSAVREVAVEDRAWKKKENAEDDETKEESAPRFQAEDTLLSEFEKLASSLDACKNTDSAETVASVMRIVKAHVTKLVKLCDASKANLRTVEGIGEVVDKQLEDIGRLMDDFVCHILKSAEQNSEPDSPSFRRRSWQPVVEHSLSSLGLLQETLSSLATKSGDDEAEDESAFWKKILGGRTSIGAELRDVVHSYQEEKRSDRRYRPVFEVEKDSSSESDEDFVKKMLKGTRQPTRKMTTTTASRRSAWEKKGSTVSQNEKSDEGGANGTVRSSKERSDARKPTIRHNNLSAKTSTGNGLVGDCSLERTVCGGDTEGQLNEFSSHLDDLLAMINDEGAPVKLGKEEYSTLYYCGRRLGREAVPGSDGRCGPKQGPQCASCQRFQKGQDQRQLQQRQLQMLMQHVDPQLATAIEANPGSLPQLLQTLAQVDAGELCQSEVDGRKEGCASYQYLMSQCASQFSAQTRESVESGDRNAGRRLATEMQALACKMFSPGMLPQDADSFSTEARGDSTNAMSMLCQLLQSADTRSLLSSNVISPDGVLSSNTISPTSPDSLIPPGTFAEDFYRDAPAGILSTAARSRTLDSIPLGGVSPRKRLYAHYGQIEDGLAAGMQTNDSRVTTYGLNESESLLLARVLAERNDYQDPRPVTAPIAPAHRRSPRKQLHCVIPNGAGDDSSDEVSSPRSPRSAKKPDGFQLWSLPESNLKGHRRSPKVLSPSASTASLNMFSPRSGRMPFVVDDSSPSSPRTASYKAAFPESPRHGRVPSHLAPLPLSDSIHERIETLSVPRPMTTGSEWSHAKVFAEFSTPNNADGQKLSTATICSLGRENSPGRSGKAPKDLPSLVGRTRKLHKYDARHYTGLQAQANMRAVDLSWILK